MSGIENSGAVEEEDDYEIPDEIEDVLEILFRGIVLTTYFDLYQHNTTNHTQRIVQVYE